MGEREQLERAMAAMETQRAQLGDAVVDKALAAFREKLAALPPEPPRPDPAERVSSMRPRASHLPISTGRAAALVGRERELARLQDAFENALSTQRLQVVSLVGESGMGKTRLLHEFLQRLDNAGTAVYPLPRAGQAPGLNHLPHALLRDLLSFRFNFSKAIRLPWRAKNWCAGLRSGWGSR